MKPTILLWKNKCWESRGSNLGDLAIIRATVDSLASLIPEAEIILLSDDPDYTAEYYGVRSERIGLLSIVKSVFASDLIIIGGGTVFTDASSMSIIPINTSIPFLGILLGKPVALWGIGSARKSLIGRLLVRLLMPYLKVISVRDEETKADLSKLYPKAAKTIRVTEDAAFAFLANVADVVRENRIVISPRRIFHYKNSFLPFYLRSRLGLLPKGYFGKMEEFKNILAALGDYAVERYGVSVSFLPMYSAIGTNDGVSGYLKTKFSSRDDVVCLDIRERMRHKAHAVLFVSDSPEKIVDYLASSRGVIGVPLHSLILSHVAGTPFLGLSYQQKVSRFMRRAGLEELMIHVEDMNCPLRLETFTQKLDLLFSLEQEIRTRIKATNAEIQKVVDTPAKMIAAFLRNSLRGNR